nr:hypothetical protein [Paenalcaligenes hominis]
MIGTTDEVLPAIPKPNPFIPYQVLRQAQAPRSTPERELQWAYQLCEVLHQAAPTLIFSHAEQDNGQLLRPSPLIESLPVKAEPDPLAQPVEHPPALERLLDEQGPPLEPDHTIFGAVAYSISKRVIRYGLLCSTVYILKHCLLTRTLGRFDYGVAISYIVPWSLCG